MRDLKRLPKSAIRTGKDVKVFRLMFVLDALLSGLNDLWAENVEQGYDFLEDSRQY